MSLFLPSYILCVCVCSSHLSSVNLCFWLFVLQPSLGFSHLPVSDEDVRTGDPTETIRRASMLPSQLTDSIANHRLSLVPPAAAPHGHAPSHRAPQVSKAREVRSTRNPLAPKRPAGQIQELDTPEVRAHVPLRVHAECWRIRVCFKSPVLKIYQQSMSNPKFELHYIKNVFYILLYMFVVELTLTNFKRYCVYLQYIIVIIVCIVYVYLGV